jgi:D-hydroxyproline dehydrogenase subunit gamma
MTSADLRATEGIERSERIAFLFDDKEFFAHDGETLLAALIAQGINFIRSAPRDASPRGPLCLMGACQECVVEVEGRRVEACRTVVRVGLRIKSLRRQAGS